PFAGAAAAIWILNAAICLAAGAFDDFWTGHVLANLLIAGEPIAGTAAVSWGSRARAFWELLMTPLELRLLWFGALGAITAGSYARTASRRAGRLVAPVRFGVMGLAIVALLRSVTSLPSPLAPGPLTIVLVGLALVLL